jgi:hypothetical protein
MTKESKFYKIIFTALLSLVFTFIYSIPAFCAEISVYDYDYDYDYACDDDLEQCYIINSNSESESSTNAATITDDMTIESPIISLYKSTKDKTVKYFGNYCYWNLIQVVGDDLTTAQRDGLLHSMNTLPHFLFMDMIKARWKIVLIDDVSDYFPEYGQNVVGMYVSKEKKIYLEKQYLIYDGMNDTLHHEMGHYITFKFVNNQELTERLYSKYANDLFNTVHFYYCTTNYKEFMAEAFNAYFSGNETFIKTVKEEMPELWEVLTSATNNYVDI